MKFLNISKWNILSCISNSDLPASSCCFTTSNWYSPQLRRFIVYVRRVNVGTERETERERERQNHTRSWKITRWRLPSTLQATFSMPISSAVCLWSGQLASYPRRDEKWPAITTIIIKFISGSPLSVYKGHSRLKTHLFSRSFPP